MSSKVSNRITGTTFRESGVPQQAGPPHGGRREPRWSFVHDPADPADVPPEPDDPVGYEDAFEAVTRVIDWYRARILEEARADSPDPQRLAQLKAERQACVGDRQELRTASPDRVATIAAAYEALWRELTRPEG
jgi:hypothetical protein